MQGSNMQFEAQRNRLPSLYEVLARKTAAPVDLYCFYIYMRDQQRSVDYLDFWYASIVTRSRASCCEMGVML